MDNIISTNELYHYTGEFENLKAILENGFTPAFCSEDYMDGNKYWSPMVCFCDIPLNLTQEHREMYGDYVIGMKREWVKNRDIYPVNYIYDSKTRDKHILGWAYSKLKKTYLESISDQIEDESKKLEKYRIPENNAGKSNSIIVGIIQSIGFQEFIKKFNELFLPVAVTMAYEKPFEGSQFNKKTKSFEYKRFYDEKEWRYILPLEMFNDHIKENFFSGIFTTMYEDSYLPFHYKNDGLERLFGSYDEIKAVLNGNDFEKVKKYSLKFQMQDIDRVIVKDHEEVQKLKDNPIYADLNILTWNDIHSA